jgi:hypothetical protein
LSPEEKKNLGKYLGSVKQMIQVVINKQQEYKKIRKREAMASL